MYQRYGWFGVVLVNAIYNIVHVSDYKSCIVYTWNNYSFPWANASLQFLMYTNGSLLRTLRGDTHYHRHLGVKTKQASCFVFDEGCAIFDELIVHVPFEVYQRAIIYLWRRQLCVTQVWQFAQASPWSDCSNASRTVDAGPTIARPGVVALK